jgi:hypothetical protein
MIGSAIEYSKDREKFSAILVQIRDSPENKETLEDQLATNAYHSYLYSKHTNKPFPKGEAAISADSYWSYQYALNILGGRFELGEDAISQDEDYSLWYASYVLHGRFIKGEPKIFEHMDSTVFYAINALKSKLPDHIHNKIMLEQMNKKSRHKDIDTYISFLNRLEREGGKNE